MNNPLDNEKLLADIFSEGRATDLRAELLGQTLRQARRQRRFRHAARAGFVFAVMTAGLLAVLHLQRPAASRAPLARPYTLIETQPLPKTAFVETQPLRSAWLVSSLPTTNVITTAAATRRFQIIDDAELLILAEPNPAVLIRRWSGSAELVFVHSTGQ